MSLEHFQDMKSTTHGGLLSIGASATANASSDTGSLIIEKNAPDRFRERRSPKSTPKPSRARQ